jgi:hypothetical protein
MPFGCSFLFRQIFGSVIDSRFYKMAPVISTVSEANAITENERFTHRTVLKGFSRSQEVLEAVFS